MAATGRRRLASPQPRTTAPPPPRPSHRRPARQGRYCVSASRNAKLGYYRPIYRAAQADRPAAIRLPPHARSARLRQRPAWSAGRHRFRAGRTGAGGYRRSPCHCRPARRGGDGRGRCLLKPYGGRHTGRSACSDQRTALRQHAPPAHDRGITPAPAEMDIAIADREAQAFNQVGDAPCTCIWAAVSASASSG